MALGRNEKCHCGSGIKYKKCCMPVDDQRGINTQSEPLTKKEHKDSFFSEYNTADLLKSFAALTLLPTNYGKNYRLEELSTHALINNNNSNRSPNSQDIRNYTEESFPSSYMEDPCVNLFTDLITFFGGDYLLLPGITESGEQMLSNLLTAIYQWPETVLPDQFKTNVNFVVRLLLLISDKVIHKAGLHRYQEGEVSEDLISVPNDEKLKQIRSAVTITDAEMDELIKKYSLSKDALNLFILNPTEISEQSLTIERNPLLYKPIVHIEGEYIIASPATIGLTLTDYIWASADQNGCVKNLGNAYHSVIWNSMQLYLGQIGFKGVFVKGEESLENELSGFYKFDDDKIAYISYVADNGKGYYKNPEHAITGSISPEETTKAIALLKADENYADFQYMHLALLSMIGRTVYYMHKALEGVKTITTPVFDIEVLWRLQNTTAIDLWKFVITKEKFNSHRLPSEFSVLDLLKFYKEHNDSFYYTDEVKAPLPPLNFGECREWLMEAKRNKDPHSINYDRHGRIVPVPVQRKDTYAPVYLELMGLAAGELKFAVEGFPQPLWVEPYKIPEALSKELKDIYWQLNDAIAFWLWQVQKDLIPYLDKLGNHPLLVTFELDEPVKFEEIRQDYRREENLDSFFALEVTEWGFNITVPSQLIAYLYGANNEGERILVMKLLEGFNQFLISKNLPIIPTEKLEEIIENNAPLGMKKKFFILDSSDNMLFDPRYLQEHRYVQEYDVSIVLDKIVPALDEECPPIGEITTKEGRQVFANKVATEVLMNMLREKLKQYYTPDLLKILIGKHESLIHKREEIRIHTPTRIACFVSEDHQAEDLEESMGRLSRTTVAIRGIIEHITAEPYYGTASISTTAVDELIGIMDQIIAWGSTSDHIYFNLFDIRIGILKSGRIGTDKKIHKDVFDPYHKSKASENVADAIEAFNQVFPQNSPITGQAIPANLDAAFKTDYGITFTRICDFIDGLAVIGFSQPQDFACLPFDSLYNQVNQGTFKFDQEEFDHAVSFLSLNHRGDVNTIPDGYQDIDIHPWRFNRLLSWMRRPLLVIEENGVKMAYWGARQVLASRIYLAEQCQMDRFRVLKEDKAVKKVLGEFAQIRGDALVKKVVDAIDSTNLFIVTDQFIGPKNEHELKNVKLIGDIDVLIIDQNLKRISSLECKAMAPSRNIREMVEESGKLFGSPEKKGWIDKHMERDEWLKANLHQITEKYGIDVTGYEVQSYFVTEEDMLTPYLREMDLPLPFLSSYSIQKEGYKALTNISKHQ